MGDLYIGLMSGTSIDSVDAVIADLSQKKPLVVSQENFEIPKNLRLQTLQLINQKKPKEPKHAVQQRKKTSVKQIKTIKTKTSTETDMRKHA